MRIANTALIAVVLLAACDKESPATAEPGAATPSASGEDAEPDLPISAGETDSADAALDQLFTQSVLEQLEGYEHEDAGNLKKVAEAFANATPSMYVHVVRDVEGTAYRPSPREIDGTDHGGAGGYWPAEDEWTPDAEGLLGYGGVPVGSYDEKGGNWIRIHRPEGYPPPLAENTPGLVWQVDGSTVWFVAFDGGRYRLEGQDLATGLPAKASWPKPVQHALLSDQDVDFLGRTGAVPKSTHNQLTRINEAFNKCAEDGWKGFDKQIAKLAKKNLTGSTRAQRRQLAYEKREKQVEKDCAKHIAAMDAALVEIIDARNVERRALFEQMARK